MIQTATSGTPLELVGRRRRGITISGGAAAAPGYAGAVLADSPLLYWRLGDTSGTTITDTSGNGKTGTYSSITLNQASLLTSDANPSVLMSNTGTMHAATFVAFPTGTEIRTFEILAKRATSTDTDTLFGGSSNSMVTLNCASGSNDITFISNSGATGTWTAAMGGTGVTKYLVLTYDPNTGAVELFVDAVSQGSKFVFGGTGPNTISCGSSNLINPFNGNLDEFAVYNGILSGARITAHNAAR